MTRPLTPGARSGYAERGSPLHTSGGFAGDQGNTLFNVVSGFTGSAIIRQYQQS